MKNLTYLSVLLISMASFVNANTLPVEVGFGMVKCPAKVCARVSVNMDPATYQALGEPTLATFKYHKLVGSNHVITNIIHTPDPVFSPFGRIITDEENFSRSSAGHSFVLTKFCIGSNFSCAEIQIKVGSVKEEWKHESLTLPMPDHENEDTITVKVSFKMLKCGAMFIDRCAAVAVTMDKKTFAALGSNTPVEYIYYKRIDPPLMSAKFKKKNGQWIIESTDTSYKSKKTDHHTFVLTQVCLENSPCVETDMRAKSFSAPLVTDFLHFSIPDK